MRLPRFLRPRRRLGVFILELTRACNHHCRYCYNVWRHTDYPRGSLSPAQWATVLDRLIDGARVKNIGLSGGEPLLYPGLIDVVRACAARKLSVTLLTNGALLTADRIQELLAAGVGLFEVPFLAPDRELHRELTGADDFETVMAALAELDRQRAKYITVFVATRRNLPRLRETVEMGIALGSRGLMFNRINPATERHCELMPTPDELREAFAWLTGISREHGYPVSSSVPIPPCRIRMTDYPELTHGYCPAGTDRAYFTIDPAGLLRLCNHSRHRLGNLLEKSLDELLDDPFVAGFREAVPEGCSGCHEWDRCRGGCKASAEVCYGSLIQPEPFLPRMKNNRK